MTQMILQLDDDARLLPFMKNLVSMVNGVKVQAIAKVTDDDIWLAEQMTVSARTGRGNLTKVKDFLKK